MNAANTQSLRATKENWLENFFRFGLVSKGVVYCLLGVLTVMAAISLSDEKTSKKDTFNFIYEQPFGKVLLALTALGLFGYVALRAFQAIKDTNHKGNDTKGIFSRIGYGFSALLYSSLGIYAAKLALRGSASNGNSKKFIVSKALELPAGGWLVGLAALVVMGVGVYQIYTGVSKKFMKKIEMVGAKFHDLFEKTGVIGYIARGIVLLVLGYMFLRAALNANLGEIKDTDGAFSFLENNFGTLLMVVVALGLVGYGIFMFVKAKYEKINLH